MSYLELKEVSKQFGDLVAVKQISLSIERGEIVSLLGPSGCGKSTLLRLIAGLEIGAGEIRLDGRLLNAISPHKRGIGFMFQDYALFPHKNVTENIQFGLQMQGWEKERQVARVAELLQLVGLEGKAMGKIDQLSGGEKQRVALARALAPMPQLLLLDEPLGALDQGLRERLMVELGQIIREVGVTAVYVTHDQLEAFAVADRVGVMNHGAFEQIGRAIEVYQKPKTPFVARFLGFQNIISASVVDGKIESELGSVRAEQLLGNRDGMLLLRSDGIELGKGVGFWEGVVTKRLFRGRYEQIWVQVGKIELLFELPVGLVIGEKISFRVKEDGWQFFPAE